MPSTERKACTKKHQTVTYQDLPLCCPMPTDTLWDAHPRVYLPIEQTGHITCPYCDTEFTLDGFKPHDAP